MLSSFNVAFNVPVRMCWADNVHSIKLTSCKNDCSILSHRLYSIIANGTKRCERPLFNGSIQLSGEKFRNSNIFAFSVRSEYRVLISNSVVGKSYRRRSNSA